MGRVSGIDEHTIIEIQSCVVRSVCELASPESVGIVGKEVSEAAKSPDSARAESSNDACGPQNNDPLCIQGGTVRLVSSTD